jgi:hypothetical protein
VGVIKDQVTLAGGKAIYEPLIIHWPYSDGRS